MAEMPFATAVKERESPEKKEVSMEAQAPPIQALAAHVRRLWERAQRAKREHENQMLANKRQREGMYSEAHLMAIKQLHGAEYDPVWMQITETKCRAAESWIKDIIFQPGVDPFDIQPTPIPEVPKALEKELEAKTLNGLIMEQMQTYALTGIQPNSQQLMSDFQDILPEMDKRLKKAIKEAAKKAAEEMKTKIIDQFHEGGYYEALDQCIYDIVTYGTAIIRGPYVRKDLVRSMKMDETTFKFNTSVEEKFMPRFKRVAPLNFYPSPDNTGENDGYVCEKISLTRKELSDLIGVDGFNSDAIRRVLDKHSTGGLQEWTNIYHEKAKLEGKSDVVFEMEKIDCIAFWGTAPGKTLREFGFDETEVDDEQKEYSIGGWLIDNDVIKAILNPDPIGNVPYSISRFSEDPDTFWGKGVPELIKHVQSIANASARSLVNNVSIASGPQVEINTDRQAPGTSDTIHPWKVWKTTNNGIQEGKAVNFYQPPMVVEKLLAVYEFCSSIADEDSGIPRYAHGSPSDNVTGENASALSMLMTQAARGVKNVIKNLDKGLIKRTVEKTFYFNNDYYADEMPEIIGDIKIVPKGSSSLIAKEQQSIRRKDFLVNTNNPVDMQIIGLPGRRELLKESIKALEMDADKILSDADEIERMAQAQQMGSLPGAEMLNAAGEPSGGGDFNLNQAQPGATS